RLESVLSLNSGLGYKKDNLAVSEDRMVRVLRGGNISNNDEVQLLGNDVMIGASFVDDSLFLRPGQLITPAVTSLENVGKVALVKEELPDTVCGGFVFFLTPSSDELSAEYMHAFLASPIHKEYCKLSVKKSGQAFYNLSKASLNNALIAIPPLAEQMRIAAALAPALSSL
ncbi:restriction endonuclease subunit S, partial [Slackia isoflavoniconvertens]|uniref:restriction endonuclease subunit S n=1 Tax=Slackia isoflavoniconvertens TaxID=572010 RepID=UPI003F9DD3C9